MKIRILATALALALAPAAAHANATSGYISQILTLTGDHSVLFNQSGSNSNVPGCGANYPSRWSIDASTAFGQSEMALILSAYALHKTVSVIGTGDCSAHADTQTVQLLVIDD